MLPSKISRYTRAFFFRPHSIARKTLLKTWLEIQQTTQNYLKKVFLLTIAIPFVNLISNLTNSIRFE